jgi:asparagine synthase (glutamine-hydrolysing)
MPPKRGFAITFDAPAPVEPDANVWQIAPNSSFVHYQLAVFTSFETAGSTACCYGEILSYGIDGLTDQCLRRALSDWEAGKLQADQLNGRFVIVIGDKRRREWHLITDRVGAMHCYAVWRGGRVAQIGTDLAALAVEASTRELDWWAIASFFSLGFFLDDRTYYTDIRILLPRSIYHFDAHGNQISHRFYFSWHHTVDPDRSYGETVEEYDALLRQAVGRCTASGRTVLPLSGGLDSRSLAAVVPPGPSTVAYSYGYSPDSVETRLASRIARVRGFTFTGHVIDPYLFYRLPEITLALHGSQDVPTARQASISGWLNQHADAVISGLWGDVWCDQMGLAGGLPGGKTPGEYTYHKMVKRGRGWLFDQVCKPHLEADNIEESLAEQVSAGLDGFEQIADLDFRLKAYKTTRWAFRWSNASLRGFEMGAVPRIPYYDVDLIDFFCTVPTGFIRDRRIQIDHLKRIAPDLARIRWQAAEANLYLARCGTWISLPRRSAAKIGRALTGKKVIESNWEVQFLSPEGRQGLHDWLLAPGLALHDHVSRQAVGDLLASFYQNPTAASGYTISMLLTFSTWEEVTQ